MKVRDLVSNTGLSGVGRLERGIIRNIQADRFTPVLFEIIPQSPADIAVKCTDSRGRARTDEQIAQIRDRAFKNFQKNVLPIYEKENQEAIKRTEQRGR